MAANDIVEKLNKLIIEPDAFLREKDVVYFFVQIRKLMEREDIFNDYKGIKFYCDWVVHPQKDQHHDQIDSIYDGIYRECVNYINETNNDESESILSLLQFKNLKNDLRPLFDRYNLNLLLLDKLWTQFTQTLLGTLKDQPLVNERGEYIKKMIITNAEKDLFIIEITFSEPMFDSHGYEYLSYTYGLGYLS